MSYLISSDYLPSLQSAELAAMAQNNMAAQQMAENAAEEEVKSHLRSKFDVSKEFTPTSIWNPAGPLQSTFPSRTPLTAPAWVSATVYSIGSLVLYPGNIYQCITGNSDVAFNPSNWLNLGASGSIPYLVSDRVYLSAQGYNAALTYALNTLVIYNAAWVASTSYVLGVQVLFTDGIIYQCLISNSDASFTASKWKQLGPQSYVGSVYVNTTAITVPEAWTAGHWTLAGQANQIFYASLPTGTKYFNYDHGKYVVSDKVYWNGSIYTCLQGTSYNDHQSELQDYNTANIQRGNVFPGVIGNQNSLTLWGVGIPYYVPQNTAITNGAFWAPGDNRDLQLVQKMVIITAYWLCLNIAPKNVPDKFIFAYMGSDGDKTHFEGQYYFPVYSALGWLQACVRGDVSPRLPKLQPNRGERTATSSRIKNINSF